MSQIKFPYATPVRSVTLLTCLVLVMAIGCSKSIGSECETDAECPTGSICDNTVRDGYCTQPDCEPGECPEGSVCVQFDRQISFCMKYCQLDDECREGYICRDDVGSAGFCYVPAD